MQRLITDTTHPNAIANPTSDFYGVVFSNFLYLGVVSLDRENFGVVSLDLYEYLGVASFD